MAYSKYFGNAGIEPSDPGAGFQSKYFRSGRQMQAPDFSVFQEKKERQLQQQQFETPQTQSDKPQAGPSASLFYLNNPMANPGEYLAIKSQMPRRYMDPDAGHALIQNGPMTIHDTMERVKPIAKAKAGAEELQGKIDGIDSTLAQITAAESRSGVNMDAYRADLLKERDLLVQQMYELELFAGSPFAESNYTARKAISAAVNTPPVSGEAGWRNAAASQNLETVLSNQRAANAAQKAQRQLDVTERLQDKTFRDNFFGQAGASYTAGDLQQRSAIAWNAYLNDPSTENRAYAENIDRLLGQFYENNREALDEDAAAPWLTQDVAGYAPQALRQFGANVAGGLLGAGLTGGTGWKAGAIAGTGVYAYNTMRGAAFKTLTDLGVDEETAKKAASDEAVLSSLIEMGDTALLLFTSGANKLLEMSGKAGLKGLGAAVSKWAGDSAFRNLAVAFGKYGIDIVGEGEEERAQSFISTANQRRALNGEGDSGLLGLARDSVKTGWNALTGKDEEARAEAQEAARAGRVIAAVGGSPDFVINAAGPVVSVAQGNRGSRSEAVAENTTVPAQQKVNSADFSDRNSTAFTNLEYDDSKAQAEITQRTHQQMVDSGEVVQIPESTQAQTEAYYPDLRGMKKQERLPILKQKISELKTELRKYLNGLKGINYEFEVNGNILDAKLYDTGIREVMEKITKNKASMLMHSDMIFRNARYLYSTPDYDGDPNVYRWNYFYTPVQIGTETVGVRIAVRDVAFSDESQIYNWGIKKDTALDGGRRGITRDPAGVSSAVSNNSIQDDSQGVKPIPSDGVGAKTSDFKRRVVDSQNHALSGIEARNAVPEDLRTQTTHDEITEAESLHSARLRLEQDYDKEKRHLENTVSWTGEDVDVGMKILEDLAREAHNTGDWMEYTRWRKVFDLHKEEIGRSLQALAKYARLTGDRIIENASKLLDNARENTDVSEVMDTVAAFASAFDEAAAKKDVNQLVQIIRDTAQKRNMSGLVRSVFGKSGLPKEIDWAINRIAELAVGDLQKYETNPMETPVPLKFSVGDRVSPSDRNNVGTIVSDHGDGTYSVRFTNPKTKAKATKTFSGEQLRPIDKAKKNSLYFPAEKYDVGKYYDFLKKFAANSIEAIAADQMKVSVAKAAKTFRYNSMLSKVATVLRNLISNGVLDSLDTIARDASVPLDMLISRFTKTRSVAVDKGWFSEAKRKGALDGLAFALMECGLDVETSGNYNKYENGAGRTFKMSRGPVERLLSSWEKLTAYNMSVTDEFSKGASEAEIQRGVDKLRAKGKVKDDSLDGAGAHEARYRTLQDDTRLSGAVSDVRKMLNNRFGVDGYGLGDFVIPFSKVPSNVPMRVIDYSPVGLANGIYRLAQVLKSAKDGTLTAAEQARAVQSIGRGMTGTLLIAGLTGLATKGLIHTVDAGGKEENRDRAASLKSQGISGTQWNLSATLRYAEGKGSKWERGDNILSVGFLEPLNAHMAIASLIAEDMEDGLTATEIATDTLAGAVQAVLELPLMQTLQDAMNAGKYSDGENFGERALDVGQTFLSGQATSWIPNSVKGIAQGLDPMQRDLYTSDNPLEQTVDNFKGSVPKLREQTPVKLDVYGNPVENENRWLNFLNANVNPGSVGTYQTTPTTELLDRVYEETGESSVYLNNSAPSDVGGVDLDENQKRQFQTDRGDAYETVVPAIGKNKNFLAVSGKMQVAILSAAEEYATQTAKEALGVGFEPEKWVSELSGKSPEEVASICVKKGIERVGGIGTPLTFSPTWASLPSDAMDGAMAEAQRYADAIALEEMGYPIEADWIKEAKALKTDLERQDVFVGRAVEAMAKKVSGSKYDGMETLLEQGRITDMAALAALPLETVERYTKYGKGNVSVETLVDVIGFQKSDAAATERDKNGKAVKGKTTKDKTFGYIRSLRLPKYQENALFRILYKSE